MSNSIVLRKVYALDSNTNQFLSSGQVLLTNTVGGTNWTNILSTLIIAGGNTVGLLPCTISSVSSVGYVNTSSVQALSSIFLPAICSMSTAIATQFPGQLTQAQLVSSVAGLGTSGYISSSALQSTISSTQAYSPPTPSTMSSIATTLASYGYISSASLQSSIVALGTTGYISSASLTSSLVGLGTLTYVSAATLASSLASTVGGLGRSGYVSTSQLVSTVSSLVGGGISTVAFTSTVAGLGSSGYISTPSLTSSIQGLATTGYISTSQLVSTTQALSSQKANIRFDNTTNVTVIDSVNTFTSASNIIYVSTFFTSSLYYSGNNLTQMTAQIPVTHDLRFSTASISLAPFSSFIDTNSRVTLDIFPQLAFSKLATGANNVAVLPISSFLQYSNTNILTTTVVNYVLIANTYMIQSNGAVITYTNSSNFFNTPIRIAIPPGTIGTNYTQPYTLVHYMPSSLNNGAFQNALHNCNVTPYFGSTGSIFVSVQNIV